MFRNYLLIAWRNLRNQKSFSLVNVLGLAMGMAACLLIVQYVGFERGYDSFHRHADRIYRVQLNSYHQGKPEYRSAVNYPALGPALQAEVPGVASFARLNPTGGLLVHPGTPEKTLLLEENQVYYADAALFDVFSFLLRSGAGDALQEPNTLLLSETAARRLFGKDSPLGETLRFRRQSQETLYTVKGVFADVPAQSHLHFEALLSYPTLVQQAGERAENAWWWYDFYTYILLKPGTDAGELEGKLPGLVEKYKGEELRKSNRQVSFTLQPLRDIHLYSDLQREASVNGNGRLVHFLSLVALLVLLLAWINYLNLATARATTRTREVGIRKAIGAGRPELFGQFLLESAVLNGIGLLAALTLFEVSLPLLRRLVAVYIPPIDWTDPGTVVLITLLILTSILLPGVYPALVLSRIRPTVLYSGSGTRIADGAWLRKGLTLIQYAVATTLLIATFAVYRQHRFMQSRDLGMDIEPVLVVVAPAVTDADSLHKSKIATFKDALLAYPAIRNVTVSNNVPGKENRWTVGQIRRWEADPGENNTYQIVAADEDFLETFRIPLLTGRGFNRASVADENAVILNEAALAALGFGSPAEAIGQKIHFWGEKTVVGVVGNYHHVSLRHQYPPLIFTPQSLAQQYFSFRVGGGLPQALSAIREQWDAFFPGNRFEYFFLADEFNRQYQPEENARRLLSLFSRFMVFLACLGLAAMAAITASQRTREIGIRKVMGATAGSIVGLLLKNFLRLVAGAGLLAMPLSWWGLNRWLENYAFRMPLSAWLFILPAGLVLLVALLTAGVLTWRAARANPVSSLRSE